jgi:hypothetical protein
MQKLSNLRGAALDPGGQDSLKALRRAAALTGAVGAIFSILFITSLWLLSQAPRAREGDQAIVDFYESDERQKIIIVGLYVLPLAAVAFIWFIAALRNWVAHSPRPRSQVIGTVQLLSGIGFITLALASAAASTMPAAVVQLSDNELSPDLAREFPLYGTALLLVFGVRMAAMFVMTTTNIASKSGLMPKWFSIVSLIVAAVLFLSASLSVWLAVIFPLWVLALGCFIIIDAYRLGPDSPLLQRAKALEAKTDEE